MINIEIVRKIIKDNTDALKDTKEKASHKTNTAEDFAWTQSRLALKNYIASLSFDDIVDLCALMDYGRDIHFNSKKLLNYHDFIIIRKECLTGICSQQTNENIATYLLQKKQKLSNYLSCALELYYKK